MVTRPPVVFENLDHTGDLGVLVEAPDLERLFERAAAALFTLVADLEAVVAVDEESVAVEAPDRETLLVAWLSELLGRHAVTGRLYSAFEVEDMGEDRLVGRVWGETMDPARHVVHGEIKAVTYHGLGVERQGGRWRARIIFDV